MSAKKNTQKSARSTTAARTKSRGFTDEERAAMQERAQELKGEERRGPRANRTAGQRLKELTAAEEARIGALVKKAMQ